MIPTAQDAKDVGGDAPRKPKRSALSIAKAVVTAFLTPTYYGTFELHYRPRRMYGARLLYPWQPIEEPKAVIFRNYPAKLAEVCLDGSM